MLQVRSKKHLIKCKCQNIRQIWKAEIWFVENCNVINWAYD